VATFTPNLGLAIPTVQGDIGLWGPEINLNPPILDAVLGGTSAINMAGGVNVTLTTAQAQDLNINLTGLLTANVALIMPQVGGFWIIQNNTTGNFYVTVQTAAGGGASVSLPQGDRAMLFSDGTNIGYVTRPGWRETTIYSPASSAAQFVAFPTPFRRFRMTLQNIRTSVSGSNISMQLSINGGSTFLSSPAQYVEGLLNCGATSTSSITYSVNASTAFSLTQSILSGASSDASFDIYPGYNNTGFIGIYYMRGSSWGLNAGSFWVSNFINGACNAGGVVNSAQVYPGGGGTFSGTVIVEGLP